MLQEAYLEVARGSHEYLGDPKLPLFLWLRLVVGERLLKLHRHHLGPQMRDAGREVSLYRGALPAAVSAALAAQLLGKHTSPTQAAVRAERLLRLQEALNTLDPIDREVLSLRHFEELSRAETALVLGIEESAAAKRYVRALKRLKDDPRRLCPGRTRTVALSMTSNSSDARLRPARPAGRRVRRALPRAANGRALQEYIDRHPELADDIRELFPALVEVEQVKDERRQPPSTRRAGRRRRCSSSATSASSARSAAAAWASSTRPSRSRSAGTWRSRCCRRSMLRDAQHKRRFEREAQGRGAGCTTPTSCRSSASASTTGTPYYVMQFIQGLGLDEVLDELQRLQAPGEARRPPADRPVGDAARDRRTSRPRDVARSLLTGRFDAGRRPDAGGRRRPSTRRGRPRADRGRPPSRPPAGRPTRSPSSSSVGRCRASRTASGRGTEADLLAERGPDRRAGGRRPGVRPQAGDPAPRHQAVEPAARRARARSGSPTSAWPRRTTSRT